MKLKDNNLFSFLGALRVLRGCLFFMLLVFFAGLTNTYGKHGIHEIKKKILIYFYK